MNVAAVAWVAMQELDAYRLLADTRAVILKAHQAWQLRRAAAGSPPADRPVSGQVAS